MCNRREWFLKSLSSPSSSHSFQSRSFFSSRFGTSKPFSLTLTQSVSQSKVKQAWENAYPLLFPTTVYFGTSKVCNIPTVLFSFKLSYLIINITVIKLFCFVIVLWANQWKSEKVETVLDVFFVCCKKPLFLSVALGCWVQIARRKEREKKGKKKKARQKKRHDSNWL